MRSLGLPIVLLLYSEAVAAGENLEVFRQCISSSVGEEAVLADVDCSAKAIRFCTSQTGEPETAMCLMELQQEMTTERKLILAQLPNVAPPNWTRGDQVYGELLSTIVKGADQIPCSNEMSAELCAVVSVEASWIDARFLARSITLPDYEDE
ncbi:hypothetical protein [Tritonibacter mobilis]|uniref:hypothetical protein n=1 Tax=Tritonibacter mobilis TaxID=379347 RepID=UPI00058754D7|nr:hypothetical protein [Rhodobacteraceae bacterium R_SAG5]